MKLISFLKIENFYNNFTPIKNFAIPINVKKNFVDLDVNPKKYNVPISRCASIFEGKKKYFHNKIL